MIYRGFVDWKTSFRRVQYKKFRFQFFYEHFTNITLIQNVVIINYSNLSEFWELRHSSEIHCYEMPVY